MGKGSLIKKAEIFNKILLTLDGSEIAEGIFPYLRDLAPRFDSELHILGVSIHPERGLDRIFKTYLDKIAADFTKEKIEAKAVLSYGNPPEEILQYSEKNKMALIAMTTHGRGGITRWLLGSTAEKVIQGAKTPVLIVRGKSPGEVEVLEKAPFSRILVPLDGSEIGEAALSCVEALAKKVKGLVTLLHVNPPLYKAIGAVEFPEAYPKEVIESLRRAGEDYLGGVSKRLKEKGVEVKYEVVTGDPAERILEHARGKKV